MALVKKPVTGMKDILPAEMQLRDYCISVIKNYSALFNQERMPILSGLLVG